MNLSVSSVLGVVRRGTRHSCAVRLCLMSLCLVLCAHGGRLGVARPRAVSQRASAWVWRWELGVCDCVECVFFASIDDSIFCSSTTRQIRHPSSPIKCTQSTAHTMQARLPPVYHLRALTQPPRRSRRYRQGSQSRPRIALSRSLRHGRPPRRCRSPLFVLLHAARATGGAPHPTIPDPKPTRTNRIGPRRPLASSACAPHSVMGRAVCT